MQSPAPTPTLVSPGHGLAKSGCRCHPEATGTANSWHLCSYADAGCQVQGLRKPDNFISFSTFVRPVRVWGCP